MFVVDFACGDYLTCIYINQARKRHEEFERKRAQHYYHAGDVLHENLKEEDGNADNKTSNR